MPFFTCSSYAPIVKCIQPGTLNEFNVQDGYHPVDYNPIVLSSYGAIAEIRVFIVKNYNYSNPSPDIKEVFGALWGGGSVLLIATGVSSATSLYYVQDGQNINIEFDWQLDYIKLKRDTSKFFNFSFTEGARIHIDELNKAFTRLNHVVQELEYNILGQSSP